MAKTYQNQHWINSVTWPKMKIYQILCQKHDKEHFVISKQHKISSPNTTKYNAQLFVANICPKMRTKTHSLFVTFSNTHQTLQLRWYCLREVYCIVLLHWRWSATRVWLPQWDYGCWQLYKHGDRAFVRSSITMFCLSCRMGESFHKILCSRLSLKL